MKKHLFFWVIASVASLILPSCENFMGVRVRGNGVIKTEDRSVGTFKNIEVGSALNVYISQAETASVKVEGDENLLRYILVTQEGDKLSIRTRQGYNLRPTGQLRIYAKTPVFDNIEVSGASNITGETPINNPEKLDLSVSGVGNIKMEVDAPVVGAEISGSGSVSLKGQTREVRLGVSGAGHAHCFDLRSESAQADISGAGSAEVFASVKLSAEVSGAGNVRYRGGASQIDQHVSGAGSVGKAD